MAEPIQIGTLLKKQQKEIAAQWKKQYFSTESPAKPILKHIDIILKYLSINTLASSDSLAIVTQSFSSLLQKKTNKITIKTVSKWYSLLQDCVFKQWEKEQKSSSIPFKTFQTFLQNIEQAKTQCLLLLASQQKPTQTSRPKHVATSKQGTSKDLIEVESLLRASTLGIACVDKNLHYLRVNQTLADLNGYTVKEHIGRAMQEILPPQLTRILAPAIKKVLKTGIPIEAQEYVAAAPSNPNQPRVWMCDHFPIQTQDGEIIGVMDLVKDITEQKRALEAQHYLLKLSAILSESLDYETTLQRVAHLIVPDLGDWCVFFLLSEKDENIFERVIIAHTDPEKKRRAEELTKNLPPRRDIPTKITRIPSTNTPVLIRDMESEEITNLAKRPQYADFLQSLNLKSYMAVPVRARGKPLGVLGIASAESGRRYNPEDLRLAESLADRAGHAVDNARLYQEAQRAIRSREDILAIVSHDLRNPLTVVSMGASVLKRKKKLALKDIHRHADVIQRAAERMNRLICDLLDLETLEKGNFTISKEENSIQNLAEEAFESCEPIAQKHAVSLEIEIEKNLPPVFCDRDRVLQVLSNLLSNAIQATPPEGKVKLKLMETEAQKTVLFTISDTGQGIAKQYMPHLFERYWRSKEVEYPGTGLGLPIAKGIIEAHNGKIWVESETGKGSIFFFYLPYEDF